MPQQLALTVDEQKLSDAWDEHLRTEFSAHSADEAITTMAANPLINQVPVMIGAMARKRSTNSMPSISCPRSRWIWR